jgi:hypothetical protein
VSDTTERTPELWGSPEAERISGTTMDEAIDEILDGFEEDPETIEVCGYAHMEPDIEKTWEGDVLERILLDLDENYGDPDGDLSDPTEAMEEAEKAFLAVVAKEYKVWMCEEVCRKTINVAEWRKRPA